jgi:DNA-binding XRE family transcriptional regulator
MHRGVRVDGDTVRRLRKAKGWSQVCLAKMAGVAERTVRNAEKDSVLESHIAGYLAVALDVPLNDIVTERPTGNRAARLKSLIHKVNSLFVRAIIHRQLQPFLAIVHPTIQWNTIAAADPCLVRNLSGIEQLRAHLNRVADWWEQFSARADEFRVGRADAEGDMIYFLVAYQFTNAAEQRLELWQTFICRFEDDLLVSVDHCSGCSNVEALQHPESNELAKP